MPCACTIGGAIVVVTATPEEGIAPLTVAFTCTNDAWTGTLAYFWEFGDNKTSNEQNFFNYFVST